MAQLSTIFRLCCLIVSAISTSQARTLIKGPNLHPSEKYELSIGGSILKPGQIRREQEIKRSLIQYLFKRIDQNNDKQITLTDLKNWLQHVMIMSSRKMALWGWSKIPRKNRNLLTWNEFLDSAYGSDEVQRQNSQLSADLRLQMRMDKRRWNAADLNGDKKLTFAEYTSFLHPQLENHMRDSLVSDVLETIDRNQDGVVSEHEYLEELARAYRSTYIQGVVEPKWVSKERVQFRKYLDTDCNGLLNHEEIGEWVLPQDYEESDAEAQYLFYHVDLSKDGVLTLDEVMSKADLFLQSQVTNFGKALEYYLDL